MSVDGKAVESPQRPTPAAESQASGTSAAPGASGEQKGSAPANPPSAEPSGTDTRQVSDALRSMFRGRVSGPTQAQPAQDVKPETDAGSQKTPSDAVPASAAGGQEKAAPAQKDGEDKAGATLTLTQAELDERIARAAQAETDRRLDKLQREAAQRRKAEERKELRKKDPYAYAQQEEEEEQRNEILQKQLEDAQRLVRTQVDAYDRTVLDPLMKLLPEEETKKILDSIDNGIPGRGQAATKALAVLQKQWHQQGVDSARKTLLNDQAFIKEVLAKYGGARIEPDLVPAASPAGPQFSMNYTLRRMAGRA